MDVRFQKDIEAYAAWQVGNRQLNRELLQYGRMREYYKGREEEMPYKSLGTFRTARRSNNLSPAFKKWKYRNADKNQYERWKEIIGEANMPKTLDDFQEIKYNKRNQADFELLRHYKYARGAGDISALVEFKLYKQGKQRLESRFVGQTIVSGTEVKSVSNHFVDRYFGTIYRKSSRDPKHEGVSIGELEEVFYKGKSCEIKTDKKGRKSQKLYIKGVCDVTINPETGELIQCNKISE